MATITSSMLGIAEKAWFPPPIGKVERPPAQPEENEFFQREREDTAR